MQWRVTRFPILASTNDLALEWIRAGRARVGDVLVAGEQTSGRGRLGRGWHSARGALLMTAVLPFSPERLGWTSLAAGIAVAEAVRELGAEAGVKWPNDVVLHGQKLAGILGESAVSGVLALGIGLNVSNPPPEDPAVAARSIRLIDVLPDVTVEAVLEAVLGRLASRWEDAAASDLTPLRRAWEEMDTTRGRRVRWSAEDLVGTAEGVDASGALVLRTEGGRVVAASVGEVTFL